MPRFIMIADGNSVVMVDHDVRVLRRADHMIEMGPMAGSRGGTIIAQGTVEEVSNAKGSVISPFLNATADILCRSPRGVSLLLLVYPAQVRQQ